MGSSCAAGFDRHWQSSQAGTTKSFPTTPEPGTHCSLHTLPLKPPPSSWDHSHSPPRHASTRCNLRLLVSELARHWDSLVDAGPCAVFVPSRAGGHAGAHPSRAQAVRGSTPRQQSVRAGVRHCETHTARTLSHAGAHPSRTQAVRGSTPNKAFVQVCDTARHTLPAPSLTLVPIRHARKLYAALPRGNKAFVQVCDTARHTLPAPSLTPPLDPTPLLSHLTQG
jgi:hypothetical protein